MSAEKQLKMITDTYRMYAGFTAIAVVFLMLVFMTVMYCPNDWKSLLRIFIYISLSVWSFWMSCEAEKFLQRLLVQEISK